MKIFCRVAVSALLWFAGGSIASAHHLWLESDDKGIRLYFGEFGENLREASPGALDRMQPQAKASSASGEQALTIEKSANAFVIAGRAGTADSIVAEDARYPVSVRTRDGVTTRFLYWPAARFVPDRAPRKALLDLDIVPSGGDRFQVVFKGKPVAKAKVEVIAASGWTRDLQTGEDGTIEVALPWRGPYVLEVHHTDKTSGKRGEEAYDSTNYVTSLTVVQPQGLEPPPPPAPAKPH